MSSKGSRDVTACQDILLGEQARSVLETDVEISDGLIRQLDKIECAGCLASQRLHSDLDDPQVVQACNILWATGAVAQVFPEMKPHQRKTVIASKHLEDIAALSAWGGGVTPGLGVLSCDYFAVAKSATKSRAIFDCHEANACCVDPPAFRLPTLAVIVQAMRCANWEGAIVCFAADLRHWFYQIGIGPGLRQAFSFEAAGKPMTLRVLPMGWRWSPFLASAVLWGLLFTKTDHASLGVTEDTVKAGMQPVVPLFMGCKRVGSVFLYLDGIFVVGPEHLCQVWRQHLYGLTRRYQVVWKEIGPIGDSADFCGVTFRIVGWDLHIEFSAEKYADFTHKEDFLANQPQTFRTVAARLSKAFYMADVLDIRWTHLQTLVAAIRCLSSEVASKHWDDSATMIPFPSEDVQLVWQVAGSSYRLVDLTPRCRQRWDSFIFVDASSTGGAAVRWDVTHRAVSTCETWREPTDPQRMYAAEMRAILRGLELALRSGDSRVVLLTDNLSCQMAVQRGWANSEELRQLVATYDDIVLHNRMVVDLLWITSEQNPADEPSRDTDVDEDKVIATLWALSSREGYEVRTPRDIVA